MNMNTFLLCVFCFVSRGITVNPALLGTQERSTLICVNMYYVRVEKPSNNKYTFPMYT
jgi:hypothetical protein